MRLEQLNHLVELFISQYGDSSTISEQLDLSKVRAKLTERQSDVLSQVEQHWILTDRPIEPGEVAEEMAKELGHNARQKALQVLDALADGGSASDQTANAERSFPFNRWASLHFWV